MNAGRLLFQIRSMILLTVCLTLPSSANAQILEKLKDALGGKTSTAPEENTAKTKNTAAKRAFYVKDVVTKSFDKQKQARTTNCFDAEEIAMQVNWTDPKSKESQKSYVDSEGYFTSYNESEGEYQKSNLVSSGVMGMIGPSMMLSVYKLPVGPYMERTENLKKQGVNANAFMYLEFAFIYDPGHFRNSNYSETKTRCRGGSDCTKFGIREKGYDDSFILFDNKDRLAEINIKIKDSPHFGTNEGLIEYFYDQTCSVSVPAAKEVRGPGLDIFR